MLNNIANTLKSFTYFNNTLLKSGTILNQQLRTTYILKRKHPAPLHKKGNEPKRLRSKHYIYETIKNVAMEKKPNLDLILLQYVEGLGNPGDNVSVSRNYGYNKLLLPGIAVYATPENVEKYEDYKTTTNEIKHSSPNAHLTANQLSQMVLSVVMNRDNPWTLQKWHIRSSFRKCGYIVPDETITLPKNPIKGPDMNLQDKEFYVTITINNYETVNVRCRIHHWSTEITERIPHVHEFWKETLGSIFSEDESVLSVIPKKGTLKKPKL